MAAMGWFCLTGSSPAPAATRQPLTMLPPEASPRVVEVLNACLATDPAERPSASSAAVDLFDATPAETVAMVALADPAAEITRRIRAAAVPGPASPTTGSKRRQTLPVSAGVALVVAVVLGAGGSWLLRGAPVEHPRAAPAIATHSRPATVSPPTRAAPSLTKLIKASSSPRRASAQLLQALVDGRAHAYAARDPALLDLVYAPGATSSGVDRGNITTALKRGGTYLGLTFVVSDVAFLDGRSGTARLRATVVTPAYQTGQPSGDKIRHPQETLGPCIFSLRMTPHGWRVVRLTTA
jgi:hypothetical protein